MARKYRSYGLKESVKTIICECIDNGSSTGWSGSEEELEKVKEFCGRYNVYYVDDMFGEWAHR